MTSLLKAPERTFNLEEIIPHYHFLLVDNCILGTKSTLADELYMVKHPDQLKKCTPHLYQFVQDVQILLGYIAQYNTLYLTPEVKEEMMPLVAHLRQVASYHQSKLSSQQGWRQKKDHLRFERKNKRHNKLLERLQDEESDLSEYRSATQQTIDLLFQAADNVATLSETFPIYQRSNDLPRLPTLKASVADAGLVGSLIDYAQKEENKKNTAAILTADGDVIRIFHTHLQALSPVEQMDLSSRLAVHIRSNTDNGYTQVGFYPSYRVRDVVSGI